jgi:hypothetical protein
MKSILISIAAILFFASTDGLTGKWESLPSPTDGRVATVIFNEDKTFETYMNGAPYINGNYSYSSKDSIFTIDDPNCGDVVGSYKVNFFSNGDSLYFSAIDDKCEERKARVEAIILGRVK